MVAEEERHRLMAALGNVKLAVDESSCEKSVDLSPSQLGRLLGWLRNFRRKLGRFWRVIDRCDSKLKLTLIDSVAL